MGGPVVCARRIALDDNGTTVYYVYAIYSQDKIETDVDVVMPVYIIARRSRQDNATKNRDEGACVR